MAAVSGSDSLPLHACSGPRCDHQNTSVSHQLATPSGRSHEPARNAVSLRGETICRERIAAPVSVVRSTVAQKLCQWYLIAGQLARASCQSRRQHQIKSAVPHLGTCTCEAGCQPRRGSSSRHPPAGHGCLRAACQAPRARPVPHGRPPFCTRHPSWRSTRSPVLNSDVLCCFDTVKCTASSKEE